MSCPICSVVSGVAVRLLGSFVFFHWRLRFSGAVQKSWSNRHLLSRRSRRAWDVMERWYKMTTSVTSESLPAFQEKWSRHVENKCNKNHCRALLANLNNCFDRLDQIQQIWTSLVCLPDPNGEHSGSSVVQAVFLAEEDDDDWCFTARRRGCGVWEMRAANQLLQPATQACSPCQCNHEPTGAIKNQTPTMKLWRMNCLDLFSTAAVLSVSLCTPYTEPLSKAWGHMCGTNTCISRQFQHEFGVSAPRLQQVPPCQLGPRFSSQNPFPSSSGFSSSRLLLKFNQVWSSFIYLRKLNATGIWIFFRKHPIFIQDHWSILLGFNTSTGGGERTPFFSTESPIPSETLRNDLLRFPRVHEQHLWQSSCKNLFCFFSVPVPTVVHNDPSVPVTKNTWTNGTAAGWNSTKGTDTFYHSRKHLLGNAVRRKSILAPATTCVCSIMHWVGNIYIYF